MIGPFPGLRRPCSVPLAGNCPLRRPCRRRSGPGRSRLGRTGVRRFRQRVELKIGTERRVRLGRSAMRRQRPHQFVPLAELTWDRHPEHVSISPREEMRRLAAIGRSRLESVIRPNRDIHLLFPVLVLVAEHEVLRTVGVRLPSLRMRQKSAAPWNRSAPARARRCMQSRSRGPGSAATHERGSQPHVRTLTVAAVADSVWAGELVPRPRRCTAGSR